MGFTAHDAQNILRNAESAALAEGKRILGDRWEQFTAEEKLAFEQTVTAMATARVTDMAGLAEAAELVRILQVALNEWKLSGHTEVVIVLKEVATTVLNIGIQIGGGLLKAAIFG